MIGHARAICSVIFAEPQPYFLKCGASTWFLYSSFVKVPPVRNSSLVNEIECMHFTPRGESIDKFMSSVSNRWLLSGWMRDKFLQSISFSEQLFWCVGNVPCLSSSAISDLIWRMRSVSFESRPCALKKLVLGLLQLDKFFLLWGAGDSADKCS